MKFSIAPLEIAGREHRPFPGCQIVPLKTHGDDRGFFREIIRGDGEVFSNRTNFGQWSHSKMGLGVVKAWHYHHLQTDWWYVGVGVVRVILLDDREESPTFKRGVSFLLGESAGSEAVVRIPPGVLHGLEVQGEGAHLFYVTSHSYNPQDEGRYPFNDPEIGWRWESPSPVVVDNDRRRTIPTNVRSDLAI